MTAEELDRALEDALADLEVDARRADVGAWLVRLPGSARPSTTTWLRHARGAAGDVLAVEAFLCRRPDDDDALALLSRLLLRRAARPALLRPVLDGIDDAWLRADLPAVLLLDPAPGPRPARADLGPGPTGGALVDRLLGEVASAVEDLLPRLRRPFGPRADVLLADTGGTRPAAAVAQEPRGGPGPVDARR